MEVGRRSEKLKEDNRLKTVRETDPSGDPGKGWRSLQNAFEKFRKRMLLIFVCFLIITLAFCAANWV